MQIKMDREKYVPRKANKGSHFWIIDTRPGEGRRWSVVGNCADASTAVRVAEGLNRQEKRLESRPKN